MRRPSWSTIFVFAVIAVLLVVINARPAFPDPDSFYHAKMALMIRDHGFIHQFPWLQETVLRDNYVDPHLLYHVILIPFVTLFDPLVGMKVSAVLFGMLAFFALYRFLRSVESPYPEWLTLAAAFSFDFLHRMSLPRAPSLSVVLLIVGVWALLKSRHKTVFAVAVAFVWYYHGWPVFFAALLCFLAADLLARKLFPGHGGAGTGKTALALVLGLVVGHVANPYFPSNVSFSVLDIFKIGVAGGPDISVGAEWSRPEWIPFVLSNVPVVTAFLASVALFLSARRAKALGLTAANARAALATVFLALFFFAFTLKSVRYVEYLIPFVLIATGAILATMGPFLSRQVAQLKADAGRLRWLVRYKSQAVVVASVIGLVSVAVVGAREIRYSTHGKDVFSEAHYLGSASWMERNLEPGAIVFNAQWDSSTIYFYLDDARYQLVGLDPRFMYDASKERYQTWFDLSNGLDPDVAKVQSVFHASAVLIDRSHPWKIVGNLESSGLYDKAYEDAWTQIYVPKPTL